MEQPNNSHRQMTLGKGFNFPYTSEIQVVLMIPQMGACYSGKGLCACLLLLVL